MGWLKGSGLVGDLYEDACKVPRLVGVYPFVTNNSLIKWSKATLAYDASIIGFTLHALAFTIYVIHRDAENPWSLSIIIIKCQLSSGYAIVLMSVASVFLHRKALQEMLRELMKFEEFTSYRVMKTNNIKTLMTFSLLFILSNHNVFFEKHNAVEWIIPNSLYTYISLGIYATITNFTGFVDIISHCFQTLIDEVGDIKRAPRGLKNIQNAKEHLVSGVERLNAVFGFQLLCVLMFSFFVTLSESYNIIAKGRDHPDESFSHLCWATIFSIHILNLIYKCSSLVWKAEELNHAVYRLMLEDTTGVMSQEIRTTLLLMNNRPVEFIPFGIVCIDLSLAGSMISAGGTYMAILTQISGWQKS